jgi:hypothetical protein
MSLIEKVINDFPNGIIDTIEDHDIPDGAASASLNWVTKGDRIEVRRGSSVVGSVATTLGPELVTNGGFVGNANGWTLGSGWSYGSNNIGYAYGGITGQAAYQAISFVVGTVYRFTATIGGTIGSVMVDLGSSPLSFYSFGGPSVNAGAGTYSWEFTAVAGLAGIGFAPVSSSFNGTITNVSLKAVSLATGSITGLHTAYRADGTPVVFRKNGQKLEYFIVGTSSDWTETGTNMFAAAAISDVASFANYSPPAGNMLFVSSPNSSIYKILVANPGDFTDLANSTQNFSGKFRMKIGQGVALLDLRFSGV